jgi:hypothetical protein
MDLLQYVKVLASQSCVYSLAAGLQTRNVVYDEVVLPPTTTTPSSVIPTEPNTAYVTTTIPTDQNVAYAVHSSNT